MIYLDNNATTRPAREVREAMAPYLEEAWGNASSRHAAGRRARSAVDQAREEVASLIGASPEEIIFTSGGTESLNTALHSAIVTHPERRRIVITATEHSATTTPCAFWESQGFEVIRIPVDRRGIPDAEAFATAVTERPSIASILWANNETGLIHPIADLAAAAQAADALLIADAVQAVGKIPVDTRDVPVSMLALSGHKFHGPKGVGALYVRRSLRFAPLLLGGGQEHDRRSGTENVPGIAGLGRASTLCPELPDPTIAALRDRFETGVRQIAPNTMIHGEGAPRLPNTSNLAFPGIDGEALLILLDQAGICVSPGSACGSAARNPSPVLTAMGLSTELAKSSVRFSLSRETTDAEIDTTLTELERILARIASVFSSDDGPVVRRS